MKSITYDSPFMMRKHRWRDEQDMLRRSMCLFRIAEWGFPDVKTKAVTH